MEFLCLFGRETWKEIVQSQRYFWNLKFLKFFCNGTNNIVKFEGCFLRALVNSNGFKAFNGCTIEFLNFTGLLAKKLENLLFLEKSCEWTIFFQVSRFECLHCNSVQVSWFECQNWNSLHVSQFECLHCNSVQVSWFECPHCSSVQVSWFECPHWH